MGKKGREGPEARYNSSLFSVIALAREQAGSLEAFGARDEYRPAAIVMCSWLNIFFPLKGGGVFGEGCEGLWLGILRWIYGGSAFREVLSLSG